MGDPDPLVEEIVRTRQARWRIVALAVFAILAVTGAGIAVTLGALMRTY